MLGEDGIRRGVIPRAFENIFQDISQDNENNYTV